MKLAKKIISLFLSVILILELIPQSVFAEETMTSPLQYEITQETNEDHHSATITLTLGETDSVQVEKVTLPNGIEQTDELSTIHYAVTETGTYSFLVAYAMNGVTHKETITVEINSLEDAKADEADQADTKKTVENTEDLTEPKEGILAKANDLRPAVNELGDEEEWLECDKCSESNPHMISTHADLDKIRTHTHTVDDKKIIHGYFKLANNITFDDADFEVDGAFYNDGQTWIPIGHTNVAGDPPNAAEFCGVFDGNGYRIENLKMTPISSAQRNRRYSGVFMALGDGGIITNTVFDNISNSTKHAGAIVVGKVTSKTATLSNITLQNCEIIPAETSNNGLAPSFLAYSLSGTISNILMDHCFYGMTKDGVPSTGAPWFSSVIATKMENCNIDGFTISNSSFKQYSDSSQLINNIAGTNSIKNVEISEIKIINTHNRMAGWVYGATAGSVLNMENVKIDLMNEFKGTGSAVPSNPTIPDTLTMNMEDVSMRYACGNGTSINSWWKMMSGAVKANGTAELISMDDHGGKVVMTLDEHIYCVEEVPDGFSIVSNDYWVTYLNGGHFEYTSGLPSDTLAVPVKKGNLFAGWYENKELTGDVIYDAKKGQSYYAKWIEIEQPQFEYSKTHRMDTLGFIPQGNWISSDPSVATVDNNGKVTGKGVGTAKISVAGSYNGYEQNFVSTVTITPLRITYKATDNTNEGLPYVIYSLKENGFMPDFNSLIGFYPVKPGTKKGTYEADTSQSQILITNSMSDKGDVYFRYRHDISGNMIETDTLPIHPTVDENGIPVGIKVELILKNPNYQFVTSETNWIAEDSTTMYVTCHENGMSKTNMYLAGDNKPLETFDDRHEYEYTGEGVVPTNRDLTTLYTKGTNTINTVQKFTAHFHPITLNKALNDSHLSEVFNTELTAEALKEIAPTELGSYTFIINGFNKDKKSYCYASRQFRIVKGTPKGEPTYETINDNVSLSEIKLEGTMRNAAGIAVKGTFAWDDDSQIVTQNTKYGWTFTPEDTAHYHIVKGTAVVWKTYYTLTFEENGGSEIKDMVIEHGKNVSEPTTTKEGYTFRGWYIDKDLTQKFDFAQPISEDMTLYAKWDKINHDLIKPITPDNRNDSNNEMLKTNSVNTGDSTNPGLWMCFVLLSSGLLIDISNKKRRKDLK